MLLGDLSPVARLEPEPLEEPRSGLDPDDPVAGVIERSVASLQDDGIPQERCEELVVVSGFEEAGPAFRAEDAAGERFDVFDELAGRGEAEVEAARQHRPAHASAASMSGSISPANRPTLRTSSATRRVASASRPRSSPSRTPRWGLWTISRPR